VGVRGSAICQVRVEPTTDEAVNMVCCLWMCDDVDVPHSVLPMDRASNPACDWGTTFEAVMLVGGLLGRPDRKATNPDTVRKDDYRRA
jgi:hypothetical protein